jgi:O-acetyl-ADP-ribose deacetylase (regulator of RNase III)
MAVSLVHGDITAQHVDAIVNAANRTLLGGGGVDGAIHRRGGSEILAECRAHRADRYPDGLAKGDAVATTAGRLPARWVIHTVGPTWAKTIDHSDELRSCYRSSLDVARELGARSIAFPLISAGLYRWPVEHAIQIALEILWPASNDLAITLVLYGEREFRAAQRIVADHDF